MAGEIGERELTPAAVAQLMAHDWPGNVRELRNVLCRAADVSKSSRWVDTKAIIRGIRRSSPREANLNLTPENARDWLQSHGGNVSAAARAAKIPRTTFRKLLRRGGVDDDDE
jgi:transcriptional regulator of acetoin/glycerol metabolism